jgi:hypothetical protein
VRGLPLLQLPAAAPSGRNWDREARLWQASALGDAAVAAGLTPEEGLVVQADLAMARRGLVLESELNLALLSTPVQPQLPVNWPGLLGLLQRLGPAGQRVAELAGLNQTYLQVSSRRWGWLAGCPSILARPVPAASLHTFQPGFCLGSVAPALTSRRPALLAGLCVPRTVCRWRSVRHAMVCLAGEHAALAAAPPPPQLHHS